MSAASESAASPSPCACTNISLMQLFHELKQKFPGVPDHVVSNTIELYCHDKHACETHLHSEAKASLTHAYHASSSAAARQLNELKVDVPLRCRNQPIVKHQVPNATAVTSVACEGPQTATLSTNTSINEVENKIKNEFGTDANQNIVEAVNHVDKQHTAGAQNLPSPVTVINLDNCIAKYCTESPSDPELTNDGQKDDNRKAVESEPNNCIDVPESKNYSILKSKRINNLHERSEKAKEKKTISKKEEPQPIQQPVQKSINQEKPIRPCTLEFIKPNPDIAFKQNLQQPEVDRCRTVSPAPSLHKSETRSNKDTTPGGSLWQDRGHPLNLSVNVNCHMDLGRGYPDPWLEEFDSPRAITSLNLTVCTPTSNMASPVRERRDEDGGFESHFTVTVSPSTVRPPPRRRAPPPPGAPTQPLEPQRTTRGQMDSSIDRSTLIARQKERLGSLEDAMRQDRELLAQLKRETAVLAAPLPGPEATRRLRDEVDYMRDQCDSLAKKLDGNDVQSFYSNIYTGQRPSRAAPSPPEPWHCQLCTYRNHEDLGVCEQCGMARIVVGNDRRDMTQDSGFGSLRASEPRLPRRSMSEIQHSILLGNSDLSERQPKSACV